MTSYANATKRACNEVDQNLFHVDLPAARLVSSLSRNDLNVEFCLILSHSGFSRSQFLTARQHHDSAPGPKSSAIGARLRKQNEDVE
jgi:hypothetical protein